MKISVVIPAFNEEKRIALCLKSVFDQTIEPNEVIVVDNASTDKTAQIARNLGAKVVEEKKKGVTFARNKGFNEASGDIIVRTDADTIVPSNWIEKYKDHFENDPKLDAISGPAIFGINAITPFEIFFVFKANKKIFGEYGLFGPNLALRKSVWERVKNEVCLDSDKVHEDTDLSVHIGKEGKIGFDKTLIVKTSARRFKQNPIKTLDYLLVKWIVMIVQHKNYKIFNLFSKFKKSLKN